MGTEPVNSRCNLGIAPAMAYRLGDIKITNPDLDLDLLADVTGLSMQTVRRRLREEHGNTLVRNAFWRHWPRDVEKLEKITLARARDAGLEREIADKTGLSERTVRRRLEKGGKTFVEKEFPELHDQDESDEEFDDDDPEQDYDGDSDDDDDDDTTTLVEATEVELLGATRVVSARSTSMTSWLAHLVAWPEKKMRNVLKKTHGRKLLVNLLGDVLPDDLGQGVEEMLGGMRIAAVRRSPSLLIWVARTARISSNTATKDIEDADGNMLVRNLFERWPSPRETEAQHPKTPAKVVAPAGGAMATPSARAQHTGQVGPHVLLANRWRILLPIGDRGGFGRVFEVRDETQPDRVGFVVKVADGETDAVRRLNAERLRSEVAIAYELHHQNICAYKDDGFDSELQVYFAIMLNAGRSLEQLIAAGTSYSAIETIEIIGQVATGLDFAHERGVIHHDVKPANILVREEHGRRDVRLGDWGISRHGRGTQRADGSPTVIATALGYSPGYRAPEQWRGEARAASDQYALALVLCSMLEGRVFTDYYRFAGLPQLSADKNEVLGRALSHEPEDRFRNCTLFVDKLRGAQ